MSELHAYLDQASKKYGSPMRFWLGPMLMVLIVDAENVEIVLKSKDCLNKPHTFYKMIRDALSVDGLFTLTGGAFVIINVFQIMLKQIQCHIKHLTFREFSEEEWKFHRRLVSPTINQQSISAHLPIFNQNIREIVSNLPINGEYFDILPWITQCKMAMFVEAALGKEWKPEVKERYMRQFAAYVSSIVISVNSINVSGCFKALSE